MRVALVHDYFVQDGGAERVLLALHRLFPEAPIFTLLSNKKYFPPGFEPRQLVTSRLQTLLPKTEWYPLITPLMPMAVEHIDLSSYDLAIISSSSFAKGVIAPPSTQTLCYLHTPTRFLWDGRHTYGKDRGWPWLTRLPLKAAFHRLRSWDYMAAQRPQQLLTNSRISQARIARYYQRQAEILHPPIDLSQIPFTRQGPGTFWLTGGRLVHYKQFDMCIQAANHLRAPLKIYGIGPDEARLKKLAGPTIEFLGRVSETKKYELYRDALAFLHPQIEDFGMSMLEVQASGTPVIAYGKGGALETIEPGTTGLFLPTSTTAALIEAMQAFNPHQFDPKHIRQHTEKFDIPHFNRTINTYAGR